MLLTSPERFSTLLNLFSWISYPKPLSCIQTSKHIVDLVSCLDQFTVPHAQYDLATYQATQPTGIQRAAWVATVSSVLTVDGNCSSIIIPEPLVGIYTRTIFADGSASYCVLVETSISYGAYSKGWGHLIVPATRSAVSRNIHLSAPHPQFDLDTVEQAAALFKYTGAKSLLLTGRTRTAFLYPSSCIEPSSTTQHYYETDPAHNEREPFVDASLAIHTWQHENGGGCPSNSCAFIQVHGKAPSTCAVDQMFISTGLGNSTTSRKWYTSDIDYPVKRLKRNLQHVFPAWNISLPSDSNCVLTATKNVVGRYINGVDKSRVCVDVARVGGVSGEFVHIEQDKTSRNEESYGQWSLALRRSFDASCGPGMLVDPLSEMCVISWMPPKKEKGNNWAAR